MNAGKVENSYLKDGEGTKVSFDFHEHQIKPTDNSKYAFDTPGAHITNRMPLTNRKGMIGKFIEKFQGPPSAKTVAEDIKNIEKDVDEVKRAIITANCIKADKRHEEGTKALLELLKQEHEKVKIETDKESYSVEEALKLFAESASNESDAVGNVEAKEKKKETPKMSIEYNGMSLTVVEGNDGQAELVVETKLNGRKADNQLEKIINKLDGLAKTRQKGKVVPGNPNTKDRCLVLDKLHIGIPRGNVFRKGVHFTSQGEGFTLIFKERKLEEILKESLERKTSKDPLNIQESIAAIDQLKANEISNAILANVEKFSAKKSKENAKKSKENAEKFKEDAEKFKENAEIERLADILAELNASLRNSSSADESSVFNEIGDLINCIKINIGASNNANEVEMEDLSPSETKEVETVDLNPSETNEVEMEFSSSDSTNKRESVRKHPSYYNDPATQKSAIVNSLLDILKNKESNLPVSVYCCLKILGKKYNMPPLPDLPDLLPLPLPGKPKSEVDLAAAADPAGSAVVAAAAAAGSAGFAAAVAADPAGSAAAAEPLFEDDVEQWLSKK
ncbi:MAG: hypothetical protein LBI56_00590 [Puniceicoccales bacterium]|nr:hypothetical protein [Puniceicoccales bacterium]